MEKMTNEEAIEILKSMKTDLYDCGVDENAVIFGRDIKAINLAIKALEDSPQGEWIRKEDVIRLLVYWSDGYSYVEIPTDDAIKTIKEMGGGNHGQ